MNMHNTSFIRTGLNLVGGWLCLMVGLSLSASAQDGQLRERMEAMKVAFFTQELSLTTEEAQAFWPVYNEFSDALARHKRSVNQKQQQMRQAFMGSDDQRVEELLDEYIELQRGEYDISKKYHAKFKEILPIRKVARLYKAEKDFRARILQEIQKRQRERRMRRN